MLLVLFVFILSSSGCLAQIKGFPPGIWYINHNGHPGTIDISISESGVVKGMMLGNIATGMWDERTQKLTVFRVINPDFMETWQLFIGYVSYSDTDGSPLLAGWFDAFRGTSASVVRENYGWAATLVEPEFPIFTNVNAVDIKGGSWSVNANGITGTLDLRFIQCSTGSLQAYIFDQPVDGWWSFTAQSVYFITKPATSNTTVAQVFTGYLYSWRENGVCIQRLSGTYHTVQPTIGTRTEYGWTAFIKDC